MSWLLTVQNDERFQLNAFTAKVLVSVYVDGGRLWEVVAHGGSNAVDICLLISF